MRRARWSCSRAGLFGRWSPHPVSEPKLQICPRLWNCEHVFTITKFMSKTEWIVTVFCGCCLWIYLMVCTLPEVPTPLMQAAVRAMSAMSKIILFEQISPTSLLQLFLWHFCQECHICSSSCIISISSLSFMLGCHTLSFSTRNGPFLSDPGAQLSFQVNCISIGSF